MAVASCIASGVRMLCRARAGGFFSDAVIQSNCAQGGRLEEDIAILLSQLGPAFAKWVEQDFN